MVYWFEDMGIMVMRLIQGLCQGFVFPSVQHVLSQWVPPNERAGLAGAVYAGKLDGLANFLSILIFLMHYLYCLKNRE